MSLHMYNSHLKLGLTLAMSNFSTILGRSYICSHEYTFYPILVIFKRITFYPVLSGNM